METGTTGSAGGRRGVFYWLACALLFFSLSGMAGCPEGPYGGWSERDGGGNGGGGEGGGGY